MIMPSAESTTDGDSMNVAMSELPTMDVNLMDTPQQPGNMATSVVTEDRSSKKSLAYRHTTCHQVLEDDFGKGYERRMCSYCDAVFSFKGGTTSAALRHIKTAHPKRIITMDNGMELPQSGQGKFQVVVDDEGSSAHVTGAVEQSISTSTSTSTHVDVVQSRNSNSNVNAVEDVGAAIGSSGENPAISLASSTASEDEHWGRSTPKRKRGNSFGAEDEGAMSGSENSGDTHNGYGSKGGKSRRSPSSKLTASQEAILHFLRYYANELPQPALRLRFAKHLTHNVGEAEMYNVLDPATQLEYIREFATN